MIAVQRRCSLSSFFFTGVAAEAVFDVVVQDEVQLLLRETVVPRQHPVDFVEDGFA